MPVFDFKLKGSEGMALCLSGFPVFSLHDGDQMEEKLLSVLLLFGGEFRVALPNHAFEQGRADADATRGRVVVATAVGWRHAVGAGAQANSKLGHLEEVFFIRISTGFQNFNKGSKLPKIVDFF